MTRGSSLQLSSWLAKKQVFATIVELARSAINTIILYYCNAFVCTLYYVLLYYNTCYIRQAMWYNTVTDSSVYVCNQVSSEGLKNNIIRIITTYYLQSTIYPFLPGSSSTASHNWTAQLAAHAQLRTSFSQRFNSYARSN
jgi:hypothetical protein